MKASFIFLAITLVGVCFVFLAAEKTQNEMYCKKINIEIDRVGEFLSEGEVKALFLNNPSDTSKQLIRQFNIRQIEKKIDQHPFIQKAQVSKEINGDLKIQVQLKEPIAKIYTQDGTSFYLEKNGGMLPNSTNYAARVLLVNGFITVEYHQNIDQNWKKNKHQKQDNNTRMLASNILIDIFAVSKYISESKFWSAQIAQIYINEEKELELVPILGKHRILFGKAESIEKKFENLYLLYTKGLKNKNWEAYKSINLKFDNQVVCTKR